MKHAPSTTVSGRRCRRCGSCSGQLVGLASQNLLVEGFAVCLKSNVVRHGSSLEKPSKSTSSPSLTRSGRWAGLMAMFSRVKIGVERRGSVGWGALSQSLGSEGDPLLPACFLAELESYDKRGKSPSISALRIQALPCMMFEPSILGASTQWGFHIRLSQLLLFFGLVFACVGRMCQPSFSVGLSFRVCLAHF